MNKDLRSVAPDYSSGVGTMTTARLQFTEDTDMPAAWEFMNGAGGQAWDKLHKVFNNFEELALLDEVKYTLREGKLVAILPTNYGYTLEITVKE